MLRKLVCLLFAYFGVVAISFTLFAADMVPMSNIHNIAYSNARSLWGGTTSGDVYGTEPILYYGLDDEIVAYMFNFSIGQLFPSKDRVIEISEFARKEGKKNEQWGVDEYSHMIVGARYSVTPILAYQKCLSQDFAVGVEVRQAAIERLGTQNVQLLKVYYITPIDNWYVFTDYRDTVFIKPSPPKKVYSSKQFNNEVRANPRIPIAPYPEENNRLWREYEQGKTLSQKANHYIPMDTLMPFYDWSYGCSPTAAAMLVAWWDNYGLYTANNYSKFIDYHFERWDGIQGETDYQAPNVQKELAIAMATDTVMDGNTARDSIPRGYVKVANTTNGYNFTSWSRIATVATLWDTLVFNINNSRPIHVSVPGHSIVAKGYTDANFMIVHNTWNPPDDFWTRNDMERVYPVIPGGSSGNVVRLTSPHGDTIYNHNGSGETLTPGSTHNITWNRDASSGYIRIYLSTNGGLSWSQVEDSTANDGSYSWSIPTDVSSTSKGRIRIELRSGTTVIGGDGSLGNFSISAMPNLTHYYGSGWPYPVVATTNTGTNWSACTLSATLPGNTSGTYLNMRGINDGNTSSSSFKHRFYVDGGYVYWGSWSTVNAGQGFYHADAGPITVKGGRHTVSDSIDTDHSITESKETDNFYAKQFVWSPYALDDQTPVSRSAPPIKDTPGYSWYNCDGFSFADGSNTYWRGVGIIPTTSGNNYNIRLHYAYTGSEAGFDSSRVQSTNTGSASDFVLVNERGGGVSGTHYAGVINQSDGTSNYYIQRADDGTTISAPETTGIFTIHSNDVMDVHEIYFGTVGFYRFTLDNQSGTANLGISLYDAHTPYFSKEDYMASANSEGSGGDEDFALDISSTGYYGLVVWKTDHSDIGKQNTYKLMIDKTTEGAWEGDVSSNWHTGGNWAGGVVPDSTTDVRIPAGTPYPVIVSVEDAKCRTLNINSGATANITNGVSLRIHGNMINYGILNVQHKLDTLYCKNNWQNYGTFNRVDSSYVRLNGKGTQYIICGGDPFYDLSIWGSGEDTARVIYNDLLVSHYLLIHNKLNTSTSGLDIKVGNYVYIYSGGILDVADMDTVSCKGMDVLSGGVLSLKDNNVSLIDSGSMYIYGTVDCSTTTYTPNIYCTGNWIDTSGTFSKGKSIVYFNGTGTQNIQNRATGETFWNLVVNKPSGTLQPANGNLTMNSLNIVAGTLNLNAYNMYVTNDATITGKLQMDDNTDDFYVYGDIYWNSGATANVTDGEFHFHGTWQFSEGAKVQLLGANTVWFEGDSARYIRSLDSTCSFNHVYVSKEPACSLGLSALSTYPIDIDGNFVIYTNNNFYSFTDQPMEVAGNWTNNGAFKLDQGTVVLNGSSPIIIDTTSGNYFNSLTINVSGACSTSAALDINGNFTISNGTFKPGNFTHYVAGNWDDTGGVFQQISGISKVYFDGNNEKTINCGTNNYFRSFHVTKTGGAKLTAISDIKTQWLYVDKGKFDIAGNTLTCTNTGDECLSVSILGDTAILIMTGGTIDLSGSFNFNKSAACESISGGTIYVAKDWIASNGINFTPTGGNVVMDGSVDATISMPTGGGTNFYNLTINKSTKNRIGNWKLEIGNWKNDKVNTVTLTNNLIVSNKLLVSNGTFDLGAGSDGNYVKVEGNDIDSSVSVEIVSGTILMDNSHDSLTTKEGDDILINSGSTLTISNGYLYQADAMDVYGVLNISGGLIETATTGGCGDFIFENGAGGVMTAGTIKFNSKIEAKSGTAWYASDGTIQAYGQSEAHFKIQDSDFYLNNVTFGDGITTKNSYLDSSSTQPLRINGDIVLSSDASLRIEPTTTIALSSSTTLSVNSGATFIAIGRPAAMAKVTRTGSGYYTFEVNSGGNIKSKYTTFEYMDANGINIKDGAIVDTGGEFDNCIFQNGISGGPLLTINNNQNIAIRNTEFPTNTWGGSYNVAKTQNQGTVTLLDAPGGFAGESYDNDPYNRIMWNPKITNLVSNRSANNVVLHWTGFDWATGYKIYRDTVPYFIPEIPNLISTTSDTIYTDLNAISSTSNYYYLVKVETSGKFLSEKSNMAYKFRQTLLDYGAARNWVAFPYISKYTNASDFTTDLDYPICSKITKLNPQTQSYASRVHTPGGWNDDFPISKGAMYEVVMNACTTFTFCGSHDNGFTIQLYDSGAGRNWVSLPYNADYYYASDITNELNYPVCVKITRLSPETQTYGSRVHLPIPPSGMWVGDFNIKPGAGYEFVMIACTLWTPSIYTNTKKELLANEWTACMKLNEINRTRYLGQTRPIWRPASKFMQEVVPQVEVASYTSSLIPVNPNEQIVPINRGKDTGFPNTVYGRCELGNVSSGSFLTYVEIRPDEVLTESSPGCELNIVPTPIGIVWVAEYGNLPSGWKDGEVGVTIIEAEAYSGKENHTGYYGITKKTLDKTLAIQEWSSPSLKEIPSPEYKIDPPCEAGGHKVTFYWTNVDDEEVIGYSIYRSEEGINYKDRVNDRVITDTYFTVLQDNNLTHYALRLVYKNGYESAYTSKDVCILGKKIPTSFALAQNVPNPFSDRTVIRYQVPVTTHIRLEIYDISGRLIRTLVNKQVDPGYYELNWDRCDEMGKEVATGIYFYKLRAGPSGAGFIKTRKLVIM